MCRANSIVYAEEEEEGEARGWTPGLQRVA